MIGNRNKNNFSFYVIGKMSGKTGIFKGFKNREDAKVFEGELDEKHPEYNLRIKTRSELLDIRINPDEDSIWFKETEEKTNFQKANEAIHNVENEWHYPIMKRNGFEPNDKTKTGMVRSYEYENINGHKVTGNVGVNKDYWVDGEEQGYWDDLEAHLIKVNTKEGKVDIKDIELEDLENQYPTNPKEKIKEIVEFSKRAFAHHGATGLFQNEIVKRFGGIPLNTGGGNIVVLIRVSLTEVVSVGDEGIVLNTLQEASETTESETIFDMSDTRGNQEEIFNFGDMSGKEKESIVEETKLQYKPALIDLIRQIKSEHHFDGEDDGKENMLSFGYLMEKYSIFNDPEVSGKILTLLEMGLSEEEIAVQVTGKIINKFNEYINI